MSQSRERLDALALRSARTLRRSWHIFVQAGGMWLERNAFVHAGSLAFYTLFSMAPVVIIAVSIAGAVFGQDAARGEIVAQLDDFVGRDAAQAVEDAVARSRPEVAGLLPSVTGFIALIVGATTVFAQMQISLNRIWGVASKPQRSGIVVLLKNRILSLAIILTIGFILLVSLLLNVALRAVIRYAEAWMAVRSGRPAARCPQRFPAQNPFGSNRSIRPQRIARQANLSQ
jgi:membrane protein